MSECDAKLRCVGWMDDAAATRLAANHKHEAINALKTRRILFWRPAEVLATRFPSGLNMQQQTKPNTPPPTSGPKQ